MKNEKIIMKLIVIFGIVLLILLFVIIFSLIKIFGHKDEQKPLKQIIESRYIINEDNELIFEFKRANVVFKTTTGTDLKIVQNTKEEKLYLNVTKMQNQLYVEEESYIFDGNNKKYTIKIPENFIGKIKVINSFGEINMYNLNSNIDIDNNSGEVNIFKCNHLNIKDVSGAINLDGIVGEASITSSTGNINIKGIDGKLYIETLTGEVIVKNFKIEGDSHIENISGDITVNINKDSTCKLNATSDSGEVKINKDRCKSKKNVFEVKNITGNINIK